METWLSGRKRLTANEVGSKSPRRFESSRLRFCRLGDIIEPMEGLNFFTKIFDGKAEKISASSPPEDIEEKLRQQQEKDFKDSVTLNKDLSKMTDEERLEKEKRKNIQDLNKHLSILK